MKNVKLIIHDEGDSSVGISAETWQIETPFIYWRNEEKETLEDFRNEIKKVYQYFSETKLTAMYDFEIERGDY